MCRNFFSSHSLTHLSEDLFAQLQSKNPFQTHLIATPHFAMNEWLKFELCKKSEQKAVLGLTFVSWHQIASHLLAPAKIPNRLELTAAIIAQEPNSSLHLVEQLASSFEEYCFYGFPKTIPDESLWQKHLFEKIFQLHGWSTYPESVEKTNPAQANTVHLFGIDYLPPAIVKLFLQLSDLNVYQFSPCAMFWEDLCSTRERAKILTRWKQKPVSSTSLQTLEELLRDTHPLLANWGMIGRSMLKEFTGIEWQENYEFTGDGASSLDLLKLDLLLMQTTEFKAIDSSIQCVKTGSSLFREIQWLRNQIIELGEPLSEIRVYAPDISAYAPFIEYYFTDIPFRIEGIDVARQSGFYQAILQLFRCVKGRWEGRDIATLFEMPSFYHKAKWRREEVARFREWIEMAHIRWGLNANHRKEVSSVDTDSISPAGSWGSGWDCLIDRWLLFSPEQEEDVSWSEVELFEQIYTVFQNLQKKLLSWKEPKTLLQWAEDISELVETTLVSDSLGKSSFDQFLTSLRTLARAFPTETFPFSWIETLFHSSPKEEGHSSLNAVRFSQFQQGAVIPARFVFLIGMDEESFPRSGALSSLHIPSKESHRKSDFDRYLFLQAIFSAEKRLFFSYGHKSKTDGKPVSPSLLIQELMAYLGQPQAQTAPSLYRATSLEKSSLITNSDKVSSSTQEPVSVQELTRFFKHPLHAYLKQVLKIELPEELESPWKDFELSALTRYKELAAFLKQGALPNLDLPLGLFGELAKRDLAQKANQFQQSLEKWGVSKDSIVTHMGGDEIASVLRKWPELLSDLIAKGTSHIHFLKTGKVREVTDPAGSLQAAIKLYHACKNHPFFLHPEWADAVLRKNRDPSLDQTKDPVLQWVLERSPAYDISREREVWQEELKSVFASLTAMFPTRGQNEDV